MQIIKPTETITFSPEGNPEEIVLIISGTKMNKIKSISIPITYKPNTINLNDYKALINQSKRKPKGY